MYVNPTTFYPANQDGKDPEMFVLHSSLQWVSKHIQDGVDVGHYESEEAGLAEVERILRFFLDESMQPQ